MEGIIVPPMEESSGGGSSGFNPEYLFTLSIAKSSFSYDSTYQRYSASKTLTSSQRSKLRSASIILSIPCLTRSVNSQQGIGSICNLDDFKNNGTRLVLPFIYGNPIVTSQGAGIDCMYLYVYSSSSDAVDILLNTNIWNTFSSTLTSVDYKFYKLS